MVSAGCIVVVIGWVLFSSVGSEGNLLGWVGLSDGISVHLFYTLEKFTYDAR